jgi:glycosyltransferase involved in cell wall biosynthesis
MRDAGPPRFDLIVATVGRVDELGRLLDSLEQQTHRNFRVLVVDQNDDDRLVPVLEPRAPLELVRLRSARGLSCARNVALALVDADVVAFPDDDCVYSSDLLECVARRLAARPELDGLTGREVDEHGRSSPSWRRDQALLTADNLWNRAISFSIFLRASVTATVGPFDESLGLGAGTPWSSGEETDYLVRAVRAGARIEYDPELRVIHPEKQLAGDVLRRTGRRGGASIGYILRKHRYPVRTVARMLVRPAGGVAVALARRDLDQARFHLATLGGRVAGYLRYSPASSTKSSA